MKKEINVLGEMIEKISESIEASKNKYIDLMVKCMVKEAKIIRDARRHGIEFSDILPEVKEAYKTRVDEIKLYEKNKTI